MSGPRSFVRALVFAAAAGVAFWLLAGPLAASFGARAAARLLILASAAAQLAVTAPVRARGLAAAALCGGIGVGVLALPLSIASTAVLAAAAFGACRSGFLYRMAPARGAVLEALLLAGGLALAAFLAGPPGYSLAMGAWGFWLVQGGYFLVGGVAARETADPGGSDPFERARTRILTLLE